MGDTGAESSGFESPYENMGWVREWVAHGDRTGNPRNGRDMLSGDRGVNAGSWEA